MCGYLSTHLQLGTWPATQACALTGNRTGDLLVTRLALNPLSHTSQGHIYLSPKVHVTMIKHEVNNHLFGNKRNFSC